MQYRPVIDKPGLSFKAPVISMEMSWGVMALVSPP